MCPVIQSVFDPLLFPPIQPLTLSQWGAYEGQHQRPYWIQEDSIHCSLLICYAGGFIIEVCLVRHYFPLVNPQRLLLLIFFSFMCPEYGFQDVLLHHLLREWGEVNWTVIFLVLLAFLEDGSDIYIPLIFEYFFWLPWLRKDYRVASQ